MSSAAGQGTVAKHAGVVGFYTMLSRVAGLVRDTVFAHLFGASHSTDAFFLAFTIPNTFRMLVAEGSLTVAFLPVFNEAQRREGDPAAKRVMSQAIGVFPSLTSLLTALCMLGAEPLVMAFAPGFTSVPGKYEFAVKLTRLMFPYLVMVSVVALCMGALNARRHFASSAASPLLFNVVHILSMVTLGRIIDPPLLGVGIGVLLGGVAEVMLQMIALWRTGLLVRPSLVIGPEVRQIMKLMAPAIAATAIYQINIMLLRLFTSFCGEGAMTYLFNADRFMQLPLGVFAIAIATASLPAFSDAHHERGAAGLAATLAQSWRLTNFVIVPATAGLMALAVPIMSTLYQHGRYTHPMAEHTGQALQAFAVGLIAIAAIRVVGQAFFAIKDTRTPVACGAVGLASNMAFAPLLAQRYDFVGLALSVGISAWLQLVVQLFFLRRRIGRLGFTAIFASVARDALAAGVMGAAVYYLALHFGAWSHGTTTRNLVVLAGTIIAGLVIYGSLQATFGSAELRRLAARLRR